MMLFTKSEMNGQALQDIVKLNNETLDDKKDLEEKHN